MAWIDRFGDRDGDGFQEYQTRSSHGMYNQGWKDAGDAIPEADGTLAPLADRHLRAPGLRLRRKEPHGRHLRRPRSPEGRAAPAARGAASVRPVQRASSGGRRKAPTTSGSTDARSRSAASRRTPATSSSRASSRLNAPVASFAASWPTTCGRAGASGRCRQTIPPTTRSRTTPARSGRTTTRRAAGGFRRYGYAAEAAQVAKGIFDAAERLVGLRLPELFSGLPRVTASFPVPYLGANVPQAWAAGSVFRFVAILCGLHATVDADGSKLYVNPALPDWLPEIAIRQPAGRRRLDGDPLPRRDRRGHLEHVTV